MQWIDWALDDQGGLIHISDITESKGAYTCLECGMPLIAKKGRIKVHHFAHGHNNRIDACGESAFHKACKRILSESTGARLELPVISMMVPALDRVGMDKTNFRLKPLHLINVLNEKSRGDYIPDATLIMLDRREIDIEVKVSHAVDAAKKEKVVNKGISMIEIDMRRGYRKRLSGEELLNELLAKAPRRWIHKTEDLDTWGIVDAAFKHYREQFYSFNQQTLRLSGSAGGSENVNDIILGLKEENRRLKSQVKKLSNEINEIEDISDWGDLDGENVRVMSCCLSPGYQSDPMAKPLYSKLGLAVPRKNYKGWNGNQAGYRVIEIDISKELSEKVLASGLKFPFIAKADIVQQHVGKGRFIRTIRDLAI